jgi:hypothetical protein
MSRVPSNIGDLKLLPGAGGGEARPPGFPAAPAAPTSAAAQLPQTLSNAAISAGAPPRQLSELPKDELEHLAEEWGLDPSRYANRQQLVAAIHDRRQLIASLDRDAMLDVVIWGRRPVTVSASKEQIAQEIARIRSMKFAGLSQRGLVVLARLRGIACNDHDGVPLLIKRLKRQEGLFSKLNRKRRALLGSIVSNMLGESEPAADYKFLPPPSGGGGATSGAAGASAAYSSAAPGASIKDEIEESGLFGGIAGRIKKSADSYVNQKLDEIEARIDRKLDEIDRRLAEWRDKEIANRIRILKITLWASVIVGAFSLIYSYVKVYFVDKTPRQDNTPAQVEPGRH